MIVAALCLAEILGMAGFAVFPALLPTFMDAWALSGADAGWLNGFFYVGYVAAVPILVSLTDRTAAKHIYLGCMALTALALLGFALWVDGYWSAMAFRFLAGVGLAGTYMPGLKIVSDHLDGTCARGQSRGIAFYTASFSIGTSLSFLMAGEVGAALGWQGAFFAASVGPIVAFIIVGLLVRKDLDQASGPPNTHLLDFRPILKSAPAMRFVIGYAAHNFELFAMRSWIVAFLVFAGFTQGSGFAGGWLTAAMLAAVVNMVGLPASILGNEAASRWGRHRVTALIMLVSAVLAAGLGLTAELSPWIVGVAVIVYGATVVGDSASLTAGLVDAAPLGQKGAAMAVHSMIGFAGAFLGPLVFGVVLDMTGGVNAPMAWWAAFAVMGTVVAGGALALTYRR